MHAASGEGGTGTGAGAGVAWRRQLGSEAGRLGPLALEAIDLRREPGDAGGARVVGRVSVLNQAAAPVREATLHFVLRDREGTPWATDWEALPALEPGQQVEVQVHWSVPVELRPGSVGLALATVEPVSCQGRVELGGGRPLVRPHACGPVRLLGLRTGVDEPDDDDDLPLSWTAEVDNPGAPLTEVELVLTVLGERDQALHEEVLSAPPVLRGRQVLAFSGWCPHSGPVRALAWTLRLATPQLHGPFDLPWASAGTARPRGTLRQ